MHGHRFATRPRRVASPVSRLPAVALLLGLPACYSWQPVFLASPPRFDPHTSVRVERSDGSRVVFDRPRVASDSLVGLAGDWSTPTAIPLAGVTRAWESRFSGKRTAVLVVTVIGVSVAVLAYAASDMEFNWSVSAGKTCMSIC